LTDVFVFASLSPFLADANEFNAGAPADEVANYQVRRE
jgi:hypothetical protein